MKRIFYLLYIIIPLYIYGCKEEGRIDQIDDSVAAPAPVTVLGTTSIPGGATIKYKTPNDDNLLGVKVVYTRNGEICESKASRYVDTLVVEGFGNTDPQEVKLYSVGVNEKLSTPVSTTIHPLNPPVQTVNFDIDASFGGVMVSLTENHSSADLAIVLMLADTIENTSRTQWVDLQTFHTKSPTMKFARRGLDPKPGYFGAYLRDRWNNVSDTIYRTLIPIEEIKLPKDRFRNAALPTDYFTPAEGNNGYRLENLWIGPEASHTGDFYASSHSAPMPQWFTIELGHKMSISRIQKWPRSNYELYSGTGPRTFEVWGSTNPNPNGSWDESWKLLGEFEQSKPSGYGEGREVGPITDEDKDYWYNRTEFNLVPTENAPDPYQTVTHLRFKILSTFNTYGTDATMSQIIIGELTFWGQLKDDE
ncbi:DUF4959 domain-containing protein [Proteiniphilum sp.]|uniref:DUF4959 domain-containing protein n=1 Tax=Proteiniphilum sp. TaxID=1926877 RepID=UPI002B213D05|nr:DUF4959 domain-containing protein [Proteiniphilum sp.]MEA4917844.1 DUF4959 domain-containing protein [Proteiniphilum sp.]